MRLNDFLSRILYQQNPPLVSIDDYLAKRFTKEEFDRKNDEWWKNPDSLPSPQIVEEAVAMVKVRLDFHAHEAPLSVLAEAMDACVAEEMPLRGFGQAGKNAKKHPRVIALSQTDAAKRSQVALAAAQALAWMEECRKWCQDANLRTQIQKRVMAAALALIAEKKTIYTPIELSVLTQIGASLKDRDAFVLGALGGIVEIIAKHAKDLPRDAKTLEACKRLLDMPDIFGSTRLSRARTQLEEIVKALGAGAT